MKFNIRRLVHHLGVFLVISLIICEAAGIGNGTATGVAGDMKRNVTSSLGVVGPPQDNISKRISKEMFKDADLTSSSKLNSTSEDENIHQKRSAPHGGVHILESGSNLRTRGEARILKRGPHGTVSRFSDSAFTLRNSLKNKQNIRSGYGHDSSSHSISSSSSSYDGGSSIPVISIPGNNVPPPVYNYNGNVAPAPPPSSISSSYGSYRPGGSGGTGSIVIASTTSLPEIIFPPDEITPDPGPKPIIGPGPGTSVPIIGGGGMGGNGGEDILPPSPPPDEIFPPAPPPDLDEFEFEEEGLGRRLKISSGRLSSGGNGSPGAPGGRSSGGFGGAGGRSGSGSEGNGSPGAPGGRSSGGFGGVGGRSGSGSEGNGSPGAPGGRSSGGFGGTGGRSGLGSEGNGSPGAPGGRSSGGFGGVGGRSASEGNGSPGSPGGRSSGGFGGAGGRSGSGTGGNGSPGAPGGVVRTRTRIVPSRLSTVEASTPLVSARETVHASGGHGGGTMRRERLRDKVKEFKTTIIEEVEPVEVEEIIVDDPNVITDFVFSDIKCFKTRESEYFGATIHLKNGFHLPYVRDRPQDPLRSEECRLEQVDGTRGSYHMTVTDLRGCGVEHCGEAMCLTMVFPRVPILALADDEVTTIKCIPQKSTISDTKSISFAGDSTENRRSSSTVEGGIQEFVAEVGVFRQNPGATNGLFVKRVNSGGVVQLGEPLQLRSVVRGTDGWKHSKLTDVKVWRMHDNFSQKLDNLDPNQATEVITLVDAQGCRNHEYLVIADDHPIKDPRNDMVHHFTFKAFLFRGQRVNEPLVVTARVHACQEYQDCVMECEGRRRVKRSPVEIHNASSIVHGFDSQLALRVVGLKDHPSSILDDEYAFDYSTLLLKERNKTVNDSGVMSCGEKMFVSGFGGGCITLLICGLGLALYTYIKQGRLHATSKNNPSSRRGQGPPPSYRYIPPSARAHTATTTTPYQKPLPPTPSCPSDTKNSTSPNQLPLPSNQTSGNNNNNEKSMSTDISQVAKLLQELAKSNGNNNSNSNSAGEEAMSRSKNSKKSTSSGKNDKPTSEYACIDETNSSETSSSSSSSEDLAKHIKKGKDGVYIVYCYNDKKNKVKVPMSAPSSTRMRRKHLKGKSKEAEDYDFEEDFIEEDGNDSETQGSQTEEMTEESDEYGEIGGIQRNVGDKNEGSVQGNTGIMSNMPLAKNQVIRRTVREVKKKSKQNNCLAFASTRSSKGGIIRRRVSSVYRDGFLSGIRGAVVQAVQDSKNAGIVRFKKAPSLGHIPSSTSSSVYNSSAPPPGKRINFSVRDRHSVGKRRQKQYQQDQYSSEGMLSEGTGMASDLDSAYSGSNCSKLTEDHLYELKRAGAGRYPDFRDFQKLQQNLIDVQRQLIRNNGGGAGVIAQGQVKQEVRRTSSSPNTANTTAVSIAHGSPPLSLGETKATHFVTRDDSTTKILIVPETHV